MVQKYDKYAHSEVLKNYSRILICGLISTLGWDGPSFARSRMRLGFNQVLFSHVKNSKGVIQFYFFAGFIVEIVMMKEQYSLGSFGS